ncbi:MAG: hypothetical protein KUG73_04490, partial [Pseudomonadales bacterium]|nr:hypothetical protein [Pseudomonadales bacterium]
MSIRYKLLLAFFLITALSIGVIATLSIRNSTQTIQLEIENTLNIIADEKVNSIQRYIQKKEANISTLSTLPVIRSALRELTPSFNLGVHNAAYLEKETALRPHLKTLQAQFDSYDLFLISPEGDIVFTVIHESDFGTNLYTGPYKKTLLARTFTRAATLLETRASIFDTYGPSQWKQHNLEAPSENLKLSTTHGKEQQSAFIAAPVFENNEFLGVIAIQLNSNDYFHLSKDFSGLKKTGEILIGKKDNDSALIISPLRNTSHAEFSLKIPFDNSN